MSSETRKAKFSRRRIVNFKNGRNLSTRTSPLPSRLNSPSTRYPIKDSPEYLKLLNRRLFNLLTKKEEQSLIKLTSSIDIDAQLYALIGLLFRSFINSWYSQITDDQKLISDALEIISQLTKELESRVKRLDTLSLLLDEVPYLLDDHLKNYRKINQDLGSSILPFDKPEDAFYSLSTHTALCEDINDEKRYLRVLTKSIIKLLIPEADRNSELASKFLNSLVSDLLLSNIIEKISQPHQILLIIQLVCNLILEKREPRSATPPKSFSEKAHSTLQYTGKLLNSSYNNHKVVQFHIFSFVVNFFKLDKKRPYLYAAIRTVTNFQSRIISIVLLNILNDTVLNFFENENFFILIIKAIRNNLFPTDEDMGPPPVIPTPEEYEIIKLKTKNMMKDVCHKFGLISGLLISPNATEVDRELDEFIISFENKAINKHLIFRFIDLLVVKLLPELTVNID